MSRHELQEARSEIARHHILIEKMRELLVRGCALLDEDQPDRDKASDWIMDTTYILNREIGKK